MDILEYNESAPNLAPQDVRLSRPYHISLGTVLKPFSHFEDYRNSELEYIKISKSPMPSLETEHLTGPKAEYSDEYYSDELLRKVEYQLQKTIGLIEIDDLVTFKFNGKTVLAQVKEIYFDNASSTYKVKVENILNSEQTTELSLDYVKKFRSNASFDKLKTEDTIPLPVKYRGAIVIRELTVISVLGNSAYVMTPQGLKKIDANLLNSLSSEKPDKDGILRFCGIFENEELKPVQNSRTTLAKEYNPPYNAESIRNALGAVKAA